MILNASALNGALSDASRVSSLPSASRPWTGGLSSGDGKYSTTASSSVCTPLFLNALPQSTGTIFDSRVPLRTAALSSGTVTSLPSRYFSSSPSSNSAAASSSLSRPSAAASANSAGIGPALKLAPRLSSSQINACIVTRSMIPRKFSSLPTGRLTGIAFARRRSFIMSTLRSKFAPTRSILLTNAMRGTPYLSA